MRGPVGRAGAAALAVALLGLPLAAAADGEAAPQPAPEARGPGGPTRPIEDLGGDRYRIGSILLDKAARHFSVPGKLLHRTGTLEYLAVTVGGMKGYESLLELDASAFDFKLACILIGLDEEQAVKPRHQFDERDAEGQAVEITLSWGVGDAAQTVPAAHALFAGDKPFDDHAWVYIGSITEGNGEFMAHTLGTLIGFVHDPYAIIEHRHGAGIGAYGLIEGNPLLPPEGTPMTVTIRARGQ